MSLLAGQSAPSAQMPVIPAPPPPPYVPPPVPPAAPIIHFENLPDPPDAVPVVELDVTVAVERASLWEGTLRVGPGAGATIANSRSQASQQHCGINPRYPQISTSFDLSVQVLSDPQGATRYSIDMNWNRPSSPDLCPDGGTRDIQLRQIVPIGPGEQVKLQGDGDVTIAIRRRP
jgi:hypothetical protein